MVRPIDRYPFRGRFAERKFFSPRLRDAIRENFAKWDESYFTYRAFQPLANRRIVEIKRKDRGKRRRFEAGIHPTFIITSPFNSRGGDIKATFVGNANKFDRRSKDSQVSGQIYFIFSSLTERE